MFFPKKLASLCLGGLILTLAACAPQAKNIPIPAVTQTPQATAPAAPALVDHLAGTQWSFASFVKPGTDTPAVAGSTVTLNFSADGQATGSAGCNSYAGRYTVGQGTISFTGIVSTLMACDDRAVMLQEQQYLQALNAASKFELSAERLVISYDKNQGTLNFVKGNAASTSGAPTATTAVPPTAAPVIGAIETPELLNATPIAGFPVLSNNPVYLDDRSTPTGLIRSLFNAIDRREYLRAYSYWRNPASTLGSFDQYQKGYATTTKVEVAFGQIGSGVGAGQLYYSVPALLTAQTSDGKTQIYAACYELHLSQPVIQAAPPFDPLSIEKGAAKKADPSATSADLLASACTSQDIPAGTPVNPAPVTDRNDIRSNNYLDDRSGPVEVLSSLFNAVNRTEYLRAYSYWENAGTSSQAPSFDQFRKGYADTASIQMTVGKVSSDAGAGQLYYSVPVVLKARTTSGAAQTFAGCYKLHLANPTIQATPPFRPLAIQSAQVKAAANDADPSALLAQACAQ